MSLYFSSINSGSNGNCYYVGNEHDAILVDVGLSCKEIEKRMSRMALSMHRLKAIFISHEHSDHIKGLAVLSKKYHLPVYISKPTLRNCSFDLNPELVFDISHQQQINIGSLTIHAFSKHHDAADPFSFTVESSAIKVGVFTDIGAVCDRLIAHFKHCHAAFLEANYDSDMLANGRYPYHLKRRITSGKGHLSNVQALNLFIEHKAMHMSHLLLSHLSKDNNDPVLVENLFRKFAGSTQVSVASRYEEGPVYFIKNKQSEVYNFNPLLHQADQLDLFAPISA